MEIFEKQKFKEEREKILEMVYAIDKVLNVPKLRILKCDKCKNYTGVLKRKDGFFLCEDCDDSRKA